MPTDSRYIREITDSPFSTQLKDLMLLTKKLRQYGLIILSGLITGILILALYVIFRRRMIYDDHYFYLPFLWFIFYSLLTTAMGISVLFMFNRSKNKGMIIYEELTEEIDWSPKRKEFIHRPSMEARIIIKEFLKSTDLPFTSGQNSQAIYLILYVLVNVATIIVMAL